MEFFKTELATLCGALTQLQMNTGMVSVSLVKRMSELLVTQTQTEPSTSLVFCRMESQIQKNWKKCPVFWAYLFRTHLCQNQSCSLTVRTRLSCSPFKLIPKSEVYVSETLSQLVSFSRRRRNIAFSESGAARVFHSCRFAWYFFCRTVRCFRHFCLDFVAELQLYL